MLPTPLCYVTDRITVPDVAVATVGDLQRLIKARATVPVAAQRLSFDPSRLLPAPLANGSFVYLLSPPGARSAQPPPPAPSARR
ncbi:NPL4-like protein [Hordeum vulgare]|nr:NPL4-like protein [Hordeum vulgare]